MKTYLLSFCLLLFIGCDSIRQREDFTSFISTQLGLHALTETSPIPEEEDETHAREDCPTGGWVGDAAGIRIRCGLCDPPYTSDAQDQNTSPSGITPQNGGVINEPYNPLNPAPIVDVKSTSTLDLNSDPQTPPNDVFRGPQTSSDSCLNGSCSTASGSNNTIQTIRPLRRIFRFRR